MKELNDIILKGEDSFTEFKSANFHNDSFAKEVVAFANTEGGEVYVGIEDTGEISGCDIKTMEEKIVNICRNSIVPPINPLIQKINYNDFGIVKVFIPKGYSKPYKVKTNNKFYIRVGSVSIEASNEELARLFQEGGFVHFEIKQLDELTADAIDLLRFKMYCEKLNIFDIEKDLIVLMKNLKVLSALEKPTVLGLLFFGNNIEFALPQAGLEMFCFLGKQKDSDIIDNKAEIKPIPELIEAGERFIKYNSSNRAVFNAEETRRQDISEYPEFVVRELLANAFAHRDWSIFGQRVRIEIFSDRLEIFSPGKLPNTLELESAISGVSYYRNPIIAQLLKDYMLIEKSGRGLLKVINFYKKNQYHLPLFEVTNTYFKITIFPIRLGTL